MSQNDPVLPPLISVCIWSNRVSLLDACLESIQRQRNPPSFELLMCSDDSDAVIATARARFPDAVIGRSTRATLSATRNFLVSRATGDLLLFLDDDVILPEGMLRRLADLSLEMPDVVAFGGPNLTPPGSSLFGQVQGFVMGSPAAGPIRKRYRRFTAGEADQFSLIGCNLAFRRNQMLPYAPRLIAAEENSVLIAMSRAGLRLRYDPELAVYHQRRATLAAFAAQMLKYGRGRGQLMAQQPRTFSPVYVAPLAAVVYLIALPVLAWAGPVALAPLGVAALGLGLTAAASFRRFQSLRASALAVCATAIMYACYGAGVGLGLLQRRLPARAMAHGWETLEVENPGS